MTTSPTSPAPPRPPPALRAACALALALCLANAQSPEFLRQADATLTNLVHLVAVEQAKRPRPIPWTDDEVPTNGPTRPLPAGWAFASNEVRQSPVPIRVSVWTVDGPAGSGWALVAEGQVGGSRSNIYRRAIWPDGRRLLPDLPTDWDARPGLDFRGGGERNQ